MTKTLTTNVFKFLAVRPAQRVTEEETSLAIIRDAKAKSGAGKRELQQLAKKFSERGAALEYLRSIEQSVLEPIAQRCRDLTRSYQRALSEDANVDADELVKKSGLVSIQNVGGTNVESLAWEALYAAYATGNEAGPMLETPTEVLRAFHFLRTLADEPKPSPALALRLLNARVAIPIVFSNAFHPTPAPSKNSAAGTGGSTTAPTGPAPRIDAVRTLAAELTSTAKLLETVASAPARSKAVAPQTTSSPSAAMWSSQVLMSTTPNLSEALPASLAAEQAAVLDFLQLDRDTPAPAASQVLRQHLQKLTDRATELAEDPEYQAAILQLAPEATRKAAEAAKSAPDVDVSGKITPLGIGDLKVVKQTLIAYVAGEVSHIENVLKGESKERTHRKLDRTETSIFTSEEEVKDTERDTQSTDRFELKREAEKSIKDDISIKAGLTVTAAYGPVVSTATADFATSTSKQESEKNSSNFAREVVDRAVSKVQTTTKVERTTKTLNEVEEVNRHSLDNGQPSTAHITGIYRWVDKKYRAQVYNYGVRLLLEFIIPEPAAYYRATRSKAEPKLSAKPPPPFLKDATILDVHKPREPLTASVINEFNFMRYAAKYGAAGVTAPPPLFTYVGISLAPNEGLGEAISFATSTKDLVIPAGYRLNSYSLAASILWIHYPKFSVQVRGDAWVLMNIAGGGIPLNMQQVGDVAGNNAQVTAGSVPVSVACYDVHKFALDIQAVCVRTDEAMTAWQLETFGKIQTAYQAMQTAYDQKVEQAESALGITMEGQNPAINRTVEKNELKKLCITMMTGQHFSQFGALTEPPNDPIHPPELDVNEALYEGPIIQFFEQAFEWEQMTYLFYPYFWGRKSNWRTSVNLSDPDPLFSQFLSAGAARVLVPVPLAYVESVEYLLKNPMHETELRKKVWRGGSAPTLDSDLYRSITEELRQQTDDLDGATPEGEPWEFTLPTTLVWLQPDDKLPVFP